MEVYRNLFLGDEADSRSLGVAVDCVVNCTSDLPFHGCATVQQQIRIPVEDNGDERQQAAFVEHAGPNVAVVAGYLAEGKKVLVHCAAGRQRSAAFVAILLLAVRARQCGTINETVAFLRKKKPDAFFGGVNFVVALGELLDKVRSKTL